MLSAAADADNATFERRSRVLRRLGGRFTPSKLVTDILFVVMGTRRGSDEVRSRLQRATWCHPPVHCVVVTEGEDDSQMQIHDYRNVQTDLPPMTRAVTLRVRGPSAETCCSRAADKKARDFFCTTHRARTLRAQYRFLPALEWAKRQHIPGRKSVRERNWSSSAASCERPLRSRLYHWVVLVDDDSFVFPANLARLLSTKCSNELLYLGDFYFDPTSKVPQYACGGGGSVFSRGALKAMDVSRCIRQHEADPQSGRIWCQQSDWMLGRCAREHAVHFDHTHGCTCSGNPGLVRERLASGTCAFFQFPNAPGHVGGPPKDLIPTIRRLVPSNRTSPAIIHQLARLG